MGLYQVRVNMLSASETLMFVSRKKAEIAYKTIREGLIAFREYRNEPQVAATVDLECGGEATYRFERMDSVTMVFPQPDRIERAFIAANIRANEIKAAIAAAKDVEP